MNKSKSRQVCRKCQLRGIQRRQAGRWPSLLSEVKAAGRRPPGVTKVKVGWIRLPTRGNHHHFKPTAMSRVSATRCWTSGLACQRVPNVVGGPRLSVPCVVITRSTLVKEVALSWLLALLHASRNVGEETQNCVAYLVSLPRDKRNVIHYETQNSVACTSGQPAKRRVECQPLKQTKHTHDNY